MSLSSFHLFGAAPANDSSLSLIVAAVVVVLAVVVFLVQRRLTQQLQRQAEALRASEEQLKLAVEGSEDAFWDWDVASGRILRGEQWNRVLGYTREQLPGHVNAFRPLVHPDDAARYEQAKEQILRDGFCRVEYRLKAIDGSWRWIFDRGKVVLRDAKGSPVRVTGAATDITLRKRIEQALVRSQALLEQTQAAAGMGGWEYDARASAFFWTRQVFLIHDLEPEGEQVSLTRALSFCDSDDREKLRSAIDRAAESGESFDLEVRLHTATREAWVRYIGRAEQSGQGAFRVYGSVQDITQRHTAEDERVKIQTKMLEAQKLESLGVLAGGIAHDFNNILTVIMGSASLAREDPEMVNESLEHIQTAANRAADLCRQMLAYAGKSRFSLEIHDLNEIVRDTVELLKLSIRKTAELEFSLHPTVLSVEADSSQLRQVIMNLVINASDAIGDKAGKIRVATYPIDITRERLLEARIGQEAPEGKYLALEIMDNGSGMTPETMNRIFDPFFTTKFTGRGLGLAAVLGIVRAHRGAFLVRSSVGQGSVFTMLIPLSLATPPVREGPPAQRNVPLMRADGKILVVDDEPEVRKIAGAILEKQGYTIALASDGYEALALALAHGMQFKCVLLDLTMPGLDGPSTFRELRALNRSVPILVMSGFSEADARKQLSVDARASFLPKPFTNDDLLQRVNALVTAPPTSSASPFP
ncbi:PAS domain-containing protein [Nibricoccus sp. IMCC34717]|uniref:PAS domain-containing hybrid sensor histidine kinase/response regulator n=1 Tax=Nibricoccus sp. IMCC34717 TaxID=3034021 RepID=UPI00384AFE08